MATKYRRFPYRTFFRWLFFFICLALIPCAPLLVYIVGRDIEQWNIDGLNQSQSFKNDPGLAREVTPDWSSLWVCAFWGAVVLFVLYLYVFWWASPKRDPKQSTYD